MSRARKPRPLRAAPYALPEVGLAHLEEILGEVTSVLGELPLSRESSDLRVRAQQARGAIAVCARDDFAPSLRSALTAKVLELQMQALVAERVERQRRELAEPRKPKKRVAR